MDNELAMNSFTPNSLTPRFLRCNDAAEVFLVYAAPGPCRASSLLFLLYCFFTTLSNPPNRTQKHLCHRAWH
jgi:hypothetical protein